MWYIFPCWINSYAKLMIKLGMMLYNVQATLREYCGNVNPNIGDRRWDNVQVTLCWNNSKVSPKHCGPTLLQHSGNVVTKLANRIGPTSSQCCGNVTPPPMLGDQHRNGVQTRWWEHCGTIAPQVCAPTIHCTRSSSDQSNSYMEIWIIYAI